MELKIGDTLFCLEQGDITRQETKAIVNAANNYLLGGLGVDGAIHLAGGLAIAVECRKIGYCPTGGAVLTTGGNLKAEYVIHTVGPVYRGGDKGEAEALASCYRSCLQLAKEKGILSLAFPSISTGAYRYPVEAAAKIALKTILDFILEHDFFEKIVLVLYDEKTYRVYREVLAKVTVS